MNTQKLEKINEEISKILDEAKLNLSEMAPIVRDKSGKHLIKNIFITPDQDRNWYNEEYFKVIDALSYTGRENLARIKYREARYVDHEGSNWILNSREKKDLIKFLSEPSKRIPEAKTNWQYAIYQFNMSAYEDSTHADCVLTIEEQNKLDDNDPRKYYLPIDLPMHNYMEL